MLVGNREDLKPLHFYLRSRLPKNINVMSELLLFSYGPAGDATELENRRRLQMKVSNILISEI